MRGSRALAVVAATGLSAALAVGAIASASASPASPASPAVGVRAVSVAAVTAVRTPFPGKKPAAVLALSLQAAKAATSVHVRGRVDNGAKGVSSFDLVIGKTGARGSVGDSVHGTLQVIRVKSTVYVNGGATFWTSSGLPADQAKRLAGKWLGLKGKGVADLVRITSLPYYTAQLAPIAPTARVAGKIVAGQQTVGLRGPGSTVYVAAHGIPYPLMVVDSNASKASVTFVEWNKRVTFKAPRALAVVTL